MVQDPSFFPSLVLSLWVAFASTIISAVLAIASALFLRQTSVGKQFGTYLFQLNLAVPHIVGAVGILCSSRRAVSFTDHPRRRADA